MSPYRSKPTSVERVWPVYAGSFPDSLVVNQIAYAAVPAQGSSVVVLAYTVPTGNRFIMSSMWQCYSGGIGTAFNPGDTLWTVDTNNASATDYQGNFVQGLVQVPVPLGSWQYGVKHWFDRPYEFEALDLIQSHAFNVNLTAGAPNLYVSGFFGLLVPTNTPVRG